MCTFVEVILRRRLSPEPSARQIALPWIRHMQEMPAMPSGGVLLDGIALCDEGMTVRRTFSVVATQKARPLRRCPRTTARTCTAVPWGLF